MELKISKTFKDIELFFSKMLFLILWKILAAVPLEAYRPTNGDDG